MHDQYCKEQFWLAGAVASPHHASDTHEDRRVSQGTPVRSEGGPLLAHSTAAGPQQPCDAACPTGLPTQELAVSCGVLREGAHSRGILQGVS